MSVIYSKQDHYNGLANCALATNGLVFPSDLENPHQSEYAQEGPNAYYNDDAEVTNMVNSLFNSASWPIDHYPTWDGTLHPIHELV